MSEVQPIIGRIGREPADVAGAVRVLNSCLGEGMYSEDGLLELDAYEQGLGLAARVGDRVVAASVMQILTPDDLSYYDVFGPEAHARLEGRTVGSLEALAVLPEHRSRRIGRGMAQHSIDWAIDRGCYEFVAISWLGQPENPSWPLLERLDFVPCGESDEIFTRDSMENGWVCPVDGNPCRCTGRLYIR
jgi:GNAT superfamily N-acetyltransferase